MPHLCERKKDMAYIAPNTTVRIMHNVPLDETYNHTVLFSSLSAQQTYFSGTVVKYTVNNQTYQRIAINKMRVEIPADNLYDCNYMSFQNTNFGNKWFYAFITKVEYVNNVTSEITYDIDVFQTYQFDITVGECFVEREHVTDDTIGANTIAEPVDCPDCEVINTRDIIFNRWRIAINYAPSTLNLVANGIYKMTNEIETNIDGKIAQTTDTIAKGYLTLFKQMNSIIKTTAQALFPSNMGEIREHQFTGIAPYITTDFITSLNESTLLDDIKHKIDAMNATGGTVTSIYQVPEELITGFGESAYFNIEPEWFEPNSKFFYIDDRTPAYYEAKNNKLYTAPYTYMKVINKQGGEMNLAFEKIQQKSFNYWGSWQNGEVEVFMANGKYGTQGTATSESLNLCRLAISNFPICNYNTNGIISRLANAVTILSKNIVSHAGMANVQDVSTTSSKERIQNREGRRVVSSKVTTGESERTSTHNRATVENYIAELGDLSNTMLGSIEHISGASSSSNCDIANDTFGFAIEIMAITAEYAKVIDNFFEHFGYAVKLNKVPNMNTRPHWNYVKASDCYITGNCPSDDLAKIISCFNNGITFWKNPSEVGNYSLNNH